MWHWKSSTGVQPVAHVMGRRVDPPVCCHCQCKVFHLKRFLCGGHNTHCKLKGILWILGGDLNVERTCTLFLSYLSSPKHLEVLSLVCVSQGERRKYTMEQTGGLHSCTLHLLHEYQKKNLLFVGRNEALGMDGKCLGSCWDAGFLLAFLCNKSVWQTIPYRTRTNHRSGYSTSFDWSLIDNLLENTIL